MKRLVTVVIVGLATLLAMKIEGRPTPSLP